jgi:hypothetical protein
MLDVFSSVINTYTLSLRFLQESSSFGRWTYLVLYFPFTKGLYFVDLNYQFYVVQKARKTQLKLKEVDVIVNSLS